MIYIIIISYLFNSIINGTTSSEFGRLPGVSIYDSHQNLITISDKNGFFSFTTNDITGTPLVFKKEGYTTLYLYEDDLSSNLKLIFEKEIIGRSEPILITAANELKEHSKYGPIEIKKINSISNIRANIKDQMDANTDLLIQESSGNGAAPIYKGFRANKLLYTVNGIRFNNAFFKSGNTPYVALFNPLYFRNISVADGAVSLVYGSDAIGGAIDFSQPDPHVDEYLTIQTGYLSANKQRYIGAVGQLSTINMSHNYSVYYNRSENLRSGTVYNKDLDFGIDEQNSGYKQLNIDYDGTFKFDENKLILSAHMGRQDEADDFFRIYHKGREAYKYNPLQYNLLSIGYEHEANENIIDIRLYRLFFQEYKDEIHKNIINIADDKITVYGIQGSFKMDRDNWLINNGFNYTSELSATEGSSNEIETASKYPNNAKQKQFGLFSTIKYILTGNWDMSFGIRYSYQHSIIPFQSSLAPEALALLTDLSAYDDTFKAFTAAFSIQHRQDEFQSELLINNAFRAPNFDDLYKLGEGVSSNNSEYYVPNYILDPEKSLNIHLKNNWFNSSVIIETDLFYSKLSNLIEGGDISLAGVDSITINAEEFKLASNQNTGDAYLAGFSLGLQYFIIDDWYFSTQGTYVYGQNKSQNQPLSKIPPLRIFNRLVYNFSNTKLSVMHTFSGKQNRLSSEDIEDSRIVAGGTPAFNRFDFQLQYLIDSFTINVEFENIMNERYRNHSSALNGAGRSINFDITYHLF